MSVLVEKVESLHNATSPDPLNLTLLFVQVMALFAIAHSRFFNVYTNTKLVNALRPVEMHISKPLQFMLWFSGLRGAVAYALALRASTEIFVGDDAHVGRVGARADFFPVYHALDFFLVSPIWFNFTSCTLFWLHLLLLGIR